MTVLDGYTIIQFPNKNIIEIILPQTIRSMTTTVSPVVSRRYKITDAEEAALLVAVKAMFENSTRECSYYEDGVCLGTQKKDKVECDGDRRSNVCFYPLDNNS